MTLCPTRLLCPWSSPDKNTGVGCLSLLQGIFPTQGSNLGLPHCRQTLYPLSHQGSPRILEWFPCPLPGSLPNPVIKLRSPALQADCLPSEPPGKPKITGVGSLSLLQGIFPTQASNGVSCLQVDSLQLSYQRTQEKPRQKAPTPPPESGRCLPQLEKSLCRSEDPAEPTINKFKKNSGSHLQRF